jgi:hypothetical protein
MDTILYGFDARAPAHVADPNWSDLRRAQYLLAPEISRPLSVDPQVWPRTFSVERTQGCAPDYWTDLKALRYLCRAKGLRENAVTLVALAVLGERDQVSTVFMPCTPSNIDLAWQPLGWDVADSGLVSGLSNCGYCAAEVDTLRREFGPQLNEHGLFTNLSAAQMFCARSDERVPEHAPFLVHQIFFIPIAAASNNQSRI